MGGAFCQKICGVFDFAGGKNWGKSCGKWRFRGFFTLFRLLLMKNLLILSISFLIVSAGFLNLSADILIVLADAIRKFSNTLIVFSDLLIGQIGRIGLVGGQLYSDLDFKPFSQPQNKNFVYKIKAATSYEVAAQK